MSNDALERFVSAQDEGGTFEQDLAELRRGRKTSRWMWFVFPQVAGLGRSSIARHYALAGLDEARRYLAHPVLGRRLRECCAAVLEAGEVPADAVFGSVDAIKLRSSMTLFNLADPDEPLFAAVIQKFFDGRPDAFTLEILT